MVGQRTIQKTRGEIDTDITIPGPSSLLLNIGRNILGLEFSDSLQDTIFGAESNDDLWYT